MNPIVPKILADLARHAACFDLERDGLGESLCKAMTDGVQANIDGQQAPDGTAWALLSPAYAESKARQYPGQPIGVRLGLMADPAQVAGDVIVMGDAALVTYGTDPDARAEAANFQEGDPPRRPARPFWGFTVDSLAATKQVLDDRFRRDVGT